jgi:hypothetical protein
MRKQWEHLSFLEFRKSDSLSDLSTYHLSTIYKSKYVFIDHLEALYRLQDQIPASEDFLKTLARNQCKVFCSVKRTEEHAIRSLLKIPFELKPVPIDLYPLNETQRRKWTKTLMKLESIDHIPENLYTAKNSNGQFLETIKPFILKLKMEREGNHEFMLEYAEELNRLRVLIRKNHLEQAEIEIEKTKCIRDQHYEKAATLREEEKMLFVRRIDLWSQVKKMQDDLPFYPGLLDLHFKLITLLNELDSKNKALRTLKRKVEKIMDDLEADWKVSKEEGESQSNSMVLQNLRAWQVAVDRFNDNRNKKRTQL